MCSTSLDLDSLRSLVAGVSLGTFSKAAQMVGRSPSTISMQMRKLEGQLGVAILHKAGRGLALTPEGEVLVDYARRLLDLNDEAINAVRGVARPAPPKNAAPKTAGRNRAQLGVQVVEVGDWPEVIPITKRMLDLFEVHFANVFDELLGPLPGRYDMHSAAPYPDRPSRSPSGESDRENATASRKKQRRR